MSKALKWTDEAGLELDCGHVYHPDLKVYGCPVMKHPGDKVDCPTCAEIATARREALEGEGRAWQILKNLLERAMPEEGQLWEILISEPEYDTFKDLIEAIDKLLEAPNAES